MFAACLLSFTMGLLSLGQEVLWIRLFGFTNESIPQAFAFVLTVYLLGIAVGAHIGKKICDGLYNLWCISGWILLIASFFDFISPWMYVILSHGKGQIIFGGCLIALTALLKAILFPIAHHLGAANENKSIGKIISKVYVSNILGATLGPLVFGVIFLQLFTTQQCFMLCGAFTFFMSLYCLKSTIQFSKLLTAALVAVIAFNFLFNCNPHSLIRFAALYSKYVQRIIETPQGIIASYHDGNNGDVILGGNVYDGRTNLNPILNSNKIDRVIILSALQKNPKKVLMIGLSVGTWLKLVTAFPGMKHIDIIEINPGYLDLMKDYPPQLSAIYDPRVNIVIDDGRRWLKNHSKNKYDLVIMNTTYYWRMYAANLLSKQFLQLIKQHMCEHAIFAFNSTSSPDALKTASLVFPNAYLYRNIIIASDYDWRNTLKSKNTIEWLSQLTLDNKKLFPSNIDIIRKFIHTTTYSLDEITAINNKRNLEVITDNNLITEYKYGKPL